MVFQGTPQPGIREQNFDGFGKIRLLIWDFSGPKRFLDLPVA